MMGTKMRHFTLLPNLSLEGLVSPRTTSTAA